MRTKWIPIVRFVLLFVIAGFLLFFAFRGISIKAVFSEIIKAKVGWVLLSVFISLIALISRAYRWKLLIEPLGYNPTLKNTTCSVAVGYLANLAFPRLGEVTRCGTLGTAENIPFNKLFGTVITERIIDVISLLTCIVFVAIIEFNRLGNFLKKNLADPLLNKINQIISTATGIIVIIALVIVTVFLVMFFIRNSKKWSKAKWAGIIEGFLKGLISIKSLHKPWLFLFHSVFIWLLYYLSVYVCLFAFPFTSHLGLAAALFLLVAGGLGMSAPVQGGIGAYHLLVSQGLLLYGVTLENGLAFATLLHSLQLIMVVVTGALALLLLFFQKKYKPIQTTPSAVGKH
jgi:glycosyltransferase 2 family protein